MKKFLALLTKEQHEFLRKKAYEENKSMSAVLREYIQKDITKYDKK